MHDHGPVARDRRRAGTALPPTAVRTVGAGARAVGRLPGRAARLRRVERARAVARGADGALVAPGRPRPDRPRRRLPRRHGAALGLRRVLAAPTPWAPAPVVRALAVGWGQGERAGRRDRPPRRAPDLRAAPRDAVVVAV